jgi:hypothetical protein
MKSGYFFQSGKQLAISNRPDGLNLPAPHSGSWTFVKAIDVSRPGLIGFDRELFEKQGFSAFVAIRVPLR